MNLKSLYEILSLKRASNSPGEFFFIEKFLLPLNPQIFVDNNNEPVAYYIKLGSSKTLFTAHIDTVHPYSNDISQKICFNKSFIWLDKN